MQLRNSLTYISMIAAAIGGIVGSGWLFGPLYAAQIAGPASITAWLVGGLLMIVIALTFAELSSTFPIVGGLAHFLRLSHGHFANFTFAWIAWLASVMVAPIETMAAMQYIANYFPALAHESGSTVNLSAAGLMLSTLFMFGLCAINYFSIELFAKTNNLIVLWKLIIPIITIILLWHSRFASENFYAYHGFAPYGIHGILHALPAAGIIFSFLGYGPAIYLAQEAKDPQRAIPFAILGAIGICILLYIALEIAFIGALMPQDLAHGYNSLHYFHDSGPIAGLLAVFGFTMFLKILYLDAIVSPFGTAFIYTATTARMNIAMSQNQYLPHFMQKLNQHSSPFTAILVNFMIGMIFFLPFPGWQSMVSFIVSCFVLSLAIGPIACASLRKIYPTLHRPFKLPFHQMICFMAFYICNLILYWTGWETIWRTFIIILLGYVCLFSQHLLQREKFKYDFSHSFWMIPYFIGIAIISYLSNFGGINKLKFGWDFILILVFSLGIYIYAICSRKTTAEL